MPRYIKAAPVVAHGLVIFGTYVHRTMPLVTMPLATTAHGLATAGTYAGDICMFYLLVIVTIYVVFMMALLPLSFEKSPPCCLFFGWLIIST